MSAPADPTMAGEPPAGLLPPPDASTVPNDGAGSIVDEHPELAAAGAFAGGLAIALILKRLGS
jgi:hypothetical protein